MVDQITVSPELAKFYRWYLEQATSPTQPETFSILATHGLCEAVYAYEDAGYICPGLHREQQLLFTELYDNNAYPFCTAAEFDADYACHTHPKRLAHAARFADWS